MGNFLIVFLVSSAGDREIPCWEAFPSRLTGV